MLRDPDLTDSRFDWAVLSGAPNIQVQEVSAPTFSLKEQTALPRALLNPRVELYHTPYFALPWVLRSSALVTVHDCIFEHDPRYMPKRWARLYYNLLMQFSLRRARAVAVPSEATARDVRRFYNVPRGKLVVTPEAADSNFRPIYDKTALERVRKDYRLHKPFILAVGARRPHKNFDLLVEAFARLESQDAQLVFVGEADERFPDDATVAAQATNDKVRFLGKVPEHDLPLLYNLATAFASPSLLEGFGLPVLEAMSCGMPVVCSDIPVFREVAGDAAMLVPPTNGALWSAALDTLLSDKGLCDKLRATGLQRADMFHWSATASALLPVYGKILGRQVPG
ncbi:MAG: glycosyltransferase family 1 protein [Chloroflexia bacterium]